MEGDVNYLSEIINAHFCSTADCNAVRTIV